MWGAFCCLLSRQISAASGEGAFLPKRPHFLNWCEEFFAACVVSLSFLSVMQPEVCCTACSVGWSWLAEYLPVGNTDIAVFRAWGVVVWTGYGQRIAFFFSLFSFVWLEVRWGTRHERKEYTWRVNLTGAHLRRGLQLAEAPCKPPPS